MAVKQTVVTAARARTAADPRRIRQLAYEGAGQEDGTEFLSQVIDQRGAILRHARLATDNADHLADEIGNLWRQAQENFLTIGYHLLEVRKIITHRVAAEPALAGATPMEQRRANETRWKAFLERLPFSQGIASQLECVARALESGKLTQAELPNNYSVAYQLTTLSEAELEAARRAEGIVGPTATRARITEFKRALRQRRLEQREALELRRKRLVNDITRLQDELAQVDAQLASMD